MCAEESKKNIGEKNELEEAEVHEAFAYHGDIPSDDSDETRASLTPQEIDRLKAVARKRFIIAFLVGIILATFGFFAGKKARSAHDATAWSCQEISVVSHAFDRQPGIACLQGKQENLLNERDGSSWKYASEMREGVHVDQGEWKL